MRNSVLKASYYYRKYVERRSLTKVNQFNFFPLGNQSKVALIYTPSGLDHIETLSSKIGPSFNCGFLVFFNWFINPLQVIELRRQWRNILKQSPNVSIHFLCNSDREKESFDAFFPEADAHYINQNVVLDPSTYRVVDDVEKEFDAVYNARMMKYKRFELAERISNLLVITCGWKSIDRNYFESIHSRLKGATWANLDGNMNYRKLQAAELVRKINQSRVGIILSAAEGACFASTEYLLSGVPVVSTTSKGGREAFFTENNSLVVEADSAAISKAVNEMIERAPCPKQVRQDTLRLQNDHRERFLRLVSDVASQHTSGFFESSKSENNGFIFDENKMLNFSSYQQFFDYYFST